MDMQLVRPGFEINITERLQAVTFLVRKFHKQTAILCESLEVYVTLTVQVRAHLLNLEICHVTDPAAKSAFVGPGTTELKTFDQTAMGQ
jgi:hypothetical protein